MINRLAPEVACVLPDVPPRAQHLIGDIVTERGRWYMRRRIIVTNLSAARVTHLVRRGSKRVRAKYANAVTFCADGEALAQTSEGYGVVAQLTFVWRHRLSTRSANYYPETSRQAITIVRSLPSLRLL